MTEDTVREFAHVYRDAVKVEGSLEIRKLIGRISDWQRSLPPSESTRTYFFVILRREHKIADEEPYADGINHRRHPAGRNHLRLPLGRFRFMYFRGKDSEAAARELAGWAQPQRIKVEFDVRREQRFLSDL